MNTENALSLMKTKAPDVAETLKVLGHPKRLLLLCLLREEHDVTHLVELCGLSQSQTSQYLKDLERRSWLHCRIQGKQRFYQINDPKIIEVLDALYEIYCEPHS